MMLAHEELLQEFQDFARTAPTAKSVMERIAQRLHEKMARYNWVGFYLVDPADLWRPAGRAFRRQLHTQCSHSAQLGTLWRCGQQRADRRSG